MSLAQQLEQELQQRGQAGPNGSSTISLQAGSGERLTVDLASLDSMSCAVNELHLEFPVLAGCAFDVIRKWAEALSKRITYLLEQLGPLEFDPQAGEALIRSTTPSQLPQGTVYYEFILQSQAGQGVTLNRYRAVKGQPGRQLVPMQLTHEVLVKLVEDLCNTLPQTP